MNVLKFGGTSVGSVKNINGVISILENYAKTDDVIQLMKKCVYPVYLHS